MSTPSDSTVQPARTPRGTAPGCRSPLVSALTTARIGLGIARDRLEQARERLLADPTNADLAIAYESARRIHVAAEQVLDETETEAVVAPEPRP